MNSRRKRSTTNDDKIAVAISKKGNWHERGSVTNGCHDRTGETREKKRDNELNWNKDLT